MNMKIKMFKKMNKNQEINKYEKYNNKNKI